MKTFKMDLFLTPVFLCVFRPTDPGSESVLQKYFVEGYLCDDQLQEIEYLLPLVQGSKVKVCVKPTDDALQDGFYMRRVDSFTYSRDNPTTGNQISQTALVGGESANPALTELFCERGWELCHFDTLLRSDFYFGPGRVFGYGEAWLQVRWERDRTIHQTSRFLI
jgi:hypothetical protein